MVARGDQIDRGIVAGALTVDFACGNLQPGLLRLDRVAVLLCGGHPLLDVVRLRPADLHRRLERLQGIGFLADHLAQRLALDLEVTLRGDLLRHGEVVARLRFVGVDDGRGADFEVALGLFELLGDRLFLPLRHGQRVLRQQHVEIGLRDAQYHVLPGLREHRLGLRHLQFGLVVGDQVLPAEQRLGQLQHIAVGIEARVGCCGPLDFEVVPVAVGGQADGRQQPGAPLRNLLAAGIELGARGGELAVVGERIAIGLQQIAGAHCGRKQQRGAQSENDRNPVLHATLRLSSAQ